VVIEAAILCSPLCNLIPQEATKAMKYFRSVFLGVVFVFAFAVARVSAQSSTPQAYSLSEVTYMTEVSMFTGQASNLKVYRSGSKELVELTIPPWAAEPKGVHQRYLFDFQAHKAYIQDFTHNACSWKNYISARAPINYDPVTGGDMTAAQLAEAKQHAVGTESVNAIPAWITESDTKDSKFRMWIAQKGDFVVKLAIPGDDGKFNTWLEVKQVDFSPPAAALFVPPANCSAQAQGDWSDTTMNAHAEANITAQGSASANLATGQAQGQATATLHQVSPTSGSRTSPAPQRAGASRMGATSPQATSRVTGVRLHLVPDHYQGPCPGHVQLVAEITTDGPGTVWYQFLAGAVSRSPEGTVSFSAAGTQTVTVDGTFRMTPRVPHASFIAIMEDEEGKHGPLNVSSGPVDYNITCTGQAAPTN
jgi:hypothetical protein